MTGTVEALDFYDYSMEIKLEPSTIAILAHEMQRRPTESTIAVYRSAYQESEELKTLAHRIGQCLSSPRLVVKFHEH